MYSDIVVCAAEWLGMVVFALAIASAAFAPFVCVACAVASIRRKRAQLAKIDSASPIAKGPIFGRKRHL